MKPVFLAAFFLFGATLGQAQQVIWADSLLGFSSEWESVKIPGQFSAKGALGQPNKIPGTGSCVNAWSSAKRGPAIEWIKVGFSHPIRAQQVAVVETHCPGSLNKLFLSDSSGKEYLVYQAKKNGPIEQAGRVLAIYFPMTTYRVKALRMELLPHYLPAPTQIDGIALSDSRDSIKVEVNVVKDAMTAGEPENLGPNLNTYADELCPVISPDGQTLYFTRQGHRDNFGDDINDQDIWYSNRDSSGGFSFARNIGKPLNNPYFNTLSSITPDGQTAVLINAYLPDGSMKKGVSLSSRMNGKWQQPQPLEIKNFYNDNVFGEYCLSVSGKFLVMTVQRDDAIGSKDLYVSFHKEDNSWTEPMNLGKTLNTADSEVSPFLAADEKTLYFSTAGWPGYGRNDMFVTHRLDDSWLRWSVPENLGPVMNSKTWDGYYTIPASGEYAYFISGKDSYGKGDVCRVKLPVSVKPEAVVLLRGIVRNRKTNLPMAADIAYEDLETGEVLGRAHSDGVTGKFAIILPREKNIGFHPATNGFVGLDESLDLRGLEAYKEVNQDLYLIPLEAGETVRLNNLFFDFAKSGLRKESMPELNRLVKLLIQFPGMVIEIRGHTDNVGEPAFNLDLSRARAKAVLDYLVGKGIAASRLSYKGFGETQPLAGQNSPEARQLNRRVEFAIMKMN